MGDKANGIYAKFLGCDEFAYLFSGGWREATPSLFLFCSVLFSSLLFF